MTHEDREPTVPENVRNRRPYPGVSPHGVPFYNPWEIGGDRGRGMAYHVFVGRVQELGFRPEGDR